MPRAQTAAKPDTEPGTPSRGSEQTTPTSSSQTKRTGRSGTSGLEGDLRSELTTIGVVWRTFDPVCGGALEASAPRIAQALVEKAKTDVKLRRWLEGVSMGGWIGVAVAVAPVGQAVVAHHLFPVLARARMRRAEAEGGEGPPWNASPPPGPHIPGTPLGVDNGELVNPREFVGGE